VLFRSEHILLGGAGDDAIVGSGGETLYGGTGDDTITVGSGDAALYGGAGNDTIAMGDAFTGTAYGGEGNDIFVLNGGADPALVNGGSGVDFLLGMQNLESVENMLDNGKLTDMDVVLVGPSSGITPDMDSLADYGITVNGDNKVVLDDEAWKLDNTKIGSMNVLENYDAYTNENGDLTLLVAKAAAETGSGG
jgi:Ca2+-binding RTX toxin-like protein